MNAQTELIPRHRIAGPLVLDLLVRDALAGGERVGLHPREFELLWRLSESPGLAVSRADLLRDVWNLKHVPSTNTLEVHVCRLRAKLAPIGASWIVATAPDGGYLLDTVSGPKGAQSAPRADGPADSPLDSYARIGDEGASRQQSGSPHAVSRQ